MEEMNWEPTILKMDIEGAEKYALHGMKKALSTIRLIEAEIHDSEDYNVLRQCMGKEFKFDEFEMENMTNVYRYTFRHPFQILKLECSNNFHTTKRILRPGKRNYQQSYPKIIFAEKVNNPIY